MELAALVGTARVAAESLPETTLLCKAVVDDDELFVERLPTDFSTYRFDLTWDEFFVLPWSSFEYELGPARLVEPDRDLGFVR